MALMRYAPAFVNICVLINMIAACGRAPSDNRTSASTPPAKAPPPEPEKGLESIARTYGDARNDAQIAKDNAFIESVRAGDVMGARQGLESGAGVNARYVDMEAFLSDGQNGYTALLYAAINGDAKMTQLLLIRGADVGYARKGKTALYHAAIKGYAEVVRLLQEAGAEGNVEQIRLTNELIRAACRGFELNEGDPYPPYPGVPRSLENAPEIADVIGRGANVNGMDPNGYTALMISANLGLVENVKTLLKFGAGAQLKAENGDTALSLAERQDPSFKHEERRQVVALLRAHLSK